MNEELTTLASGKFLTLVKRGKWEFVQRANASGVAVVIAVTPEGKLLLTEQFRPPIESNLIELPAGLAGDTQGSEDEALHSAAHRELEEETGYQANEMQEMTFGPSSAGLSAEIIHFFLASGLKKVSLGGGVDGEEIIVHEVPLSEVEGFLAQKQAEGCLIDYKVFVGLYFVHRPRRSGTA